MSAPGAKALRQPRIAAALAIRLSESSIVEPSSSTPSAPCEMMWMASMSCCPASACEIWSMPPRLESMSTVSTLRVASLCTSASSCSYPLTAVSMKTISRRCVCVVAPLKLARLMSLPVTVRAERTSAATGEPLRSSRCSSSSEALNAHRASHLRRDVAGRRTDGIYGPNRNFSACSLTFWCQRCIRMNSIFVHGGTAITTWPPVRDRKTQAAGRENRLAAW